MHLEGYTFLKQCAGSEDLEIACAAAKVPPLEALKAPGVEGEVVRLFEKLLSHPDASVRVRLMIKLQSQGHTVILSVSSHPCYHV
jgi:hypothetical protein